jgi:LysM repeat protein
VRDDPEIGTGTGTQDDDDASPVDISSASGEAGDYAPTISIPSQEYTVQRGDNLSTLAQKNNLSVRELLAANPQITNPDQLRTGETINIPSETGSRTYDQGVGSRSDTQAGLRSGRFTNRQGF